MTTDSDIFKKDIREYISSNFLFGVNSETIDDDSSFLDSGIIDSTGILEVITFVEERFSITVNDTEILPENFDSISKLSQYISNKVGV